MSLLLNADFYILTVQEIKCNQSQQWNAGSLDN